ncbi:Branched-chain amino acid transport ATP-binding protein LivF [Paraburkholderia caribensis MBA4]|uniref:Branched-chain amino acid transport ATP-binding protein LivF n=1 Tax=Paraburkholderia caribensis MBA4 TaxID=1323664 RepID=A0A0P0RIY6_9BURK|nr:ABC transporter ATP-binding protein [Paraburkholderia caribensis]ALL68470.1 Branched-chain amino acid transport ATP-binding protein LivF [Paraburkholderia caribensis MBA4]
MTLLSIEGLAVEHGKIRALWDVNLSVNTGERVGLLGVNGAGKTTTLGAIIGLFPPAEGRIRFEGDDIGRLSVKERTARGIALVPEGRRLFTQMTVDENLRLGAYVPSHRKSLTKNLDFVYSLFPILKEKRGQSAGDLSGGQQQMVAIGRALLSEPKLLLLDEPFLGVAPLIIKEVFDALASIADTGVTILLVEQNIHRALGFLTRAYVMEGGRIVLNADTNELQRDTTFNERYLGLI